MFKGSFLCFSLCLLSCLKRHKLCLWKGVTEKCVTEKCPSAQYLLWTLPSGSCINLKTLSVVFSSLVPAFPHKRGSNSFILAAFCWTLMSTSYIPCSGDTMAEPVSSFPQLCIAWGCAPPGQEHLQTCLGLVPPCTQPL